MAITYTYVFETDSGAEPGAVWALYADADSWPRWDAGCERVTRDDEFATGTNGTMKLVGVDEPMRFRLTDVVPGHGFVDETPAGPSTVRVAHTISPREGGGSRVRHQVQIEGPAEHAAQIGPAITGDMPASVHALLTLAERRS